MRINRSSRGMWEAETFCSSEKEVSLRTGRHERGGEDLERSGISVVGPSASDHRSLAAVDPQTVCLDLGPGGPTPSGQSPDDRPGAARQEAGDEAAHLWAHQTGDSLAASDPDQMRTLGREDSGVSGTGYGLAQRGELQRDVRLLAGPASASSLENCRDLKRF
jgi:hypothetical protein